MYIKTSPQTPELAGWLAGLMDGWISLIGELSNCLIMCQNSS